MRRPPVLVALFAVGMLATALLIAGRHRGWWWLPPRAPAGWARGWMVAGLLAVLVAAGAVALVSRASVKPHARGTLVFPFLGLAGLPAQPGQRTDLQTLVVTGNGVTGRGWTLLRQQKWGG